MAEKQQIDSEKLEEILNAAIDLTENRSTYITNVRLRLSNSEVTLDLFYVSPDPRNPSGLPIAQRTHRLILPLSLAKNVGELLVSMANQWEEIFGITLPIMPAENTLEVDEDKNVPS
jgi:hypothetical protein